MDTIFEGLQEQSRSKPANELRRFIEVDNHEAVKIGDLEIYSEAIKVVGPDVDRHFPRRGGPGRGGRIGTSKRRRRCSALLHQHRHSGGQQMESTTRGRRLARNLSGHLLERRGSGMGELVAEVRGHEQGS